MLQPPSAAPLVRARRALVALLVRLCNRHPFVSIFLLLFVSNLAGSVFNISYNKALIMARHMDPGQQHVFEDVAIPIYNVVAYPVCLGLMGYLLWPIWLCHRDLGAGREVPPARLLRCRRRLVNLPLYQVIINSLGWLPGAVFFPLLVCGLGGGHDAGMIWWHFGVSSLVATLLTTMQTFVLTEGFLIAFLYPVFFRDARPADAGGVTIPFRIRLLLMWGAVAVMPLFALLVVALNIRSPADAYLALVVAAGGFVSGGLIFAFVGGGLLKWIKAHTAATEQIAEDHFEVRIEEKRPDEWGKLTDRFNEMTMRLGRAKQVREVFGQFVSPQMRDEILQNYTGLAGDIQDITVLFADIRGFTRRSAGEPPERVVELLNRFLSLAVSAVEETGGWVNKFLGDGIMALFNVLQPRADHADLAVKAARELLIRLEDLNQDLAKQGQAPLAVGIGIHSGPALVGCIGAMLPLETGQQRIRKEFTAIGETVNLGQRIEQLTKACGGPILLSQATHDRLKREVPLLDLGSQEVPGCQERLRVYRVLPM
jgi:adenylate cyclase